MPPDDLRRQAGPHVFVDDLDVLELAEADRHHLARVLRVRDGDPLTASDGRGSWRQVAFGTQLRPVGPVIRVAGNAHEVGLAIALAKSGKPELVVQKATEIGVDRIVVFHGARSVVRWDRPKRGKALDRLRRVAREAAMQSRQVRLPVVEFVEDLSTLSALGHVWRADFEGTPLDRTHRLIAIGPEGGWSDEEIEAVPDTVDLGPSVLRAETAAIVAAAHLISLRRR